MAFSKEAKTIEEHITLLRERGLKIEDEAMAKHILSHISYYRLAGYWWPMQEDKVNHIFKKNSRFSDVVNLYNFDRELRILLFDVIEKIEISLRTKMIYHLSHEFDPWWFENKKIFKNEWERKQTLKSLKEEVSRSKEVFVIQHRKKHEDDKRLPPSWKTLEIASLGSLSRLYGNLRNDVNSKDIIAQELGAVNHTYLPSWMLSITQMRNFCAHHSRIWNKNLPGRPKLLKSPPYPWINDKPSPAEFQKLYIHLCIMKYLLNIVQPDNHFTEKLKVLIEKYSNVDPKALGIKENWVNEPLWSK